MVDTSPGNARPALLPGGVMALAVALLVALLGILRPALPVAGTVANATVRDVARSEALFALRDWPRLRFPQFTLYYAPGLAQDAAVAAATAKRYYPQVLRDYGLPQSTPATLVVVGPDDMSRFIGSGTTDPPLGAYDNGIIWLLAPSAVVAGANVAQQYAQAGPVPHELTHYADDLVSGGRTPAWLDEGLAQYEEWRLSGWVWVESDSDFSGGVYSWTRLTQDFDQLPNVALAYRQTLAATAAICRTGPGACESVLRRLRAGSSLNDALLRAVGKARLSALQDGAAWKPGSEPTPGAPAGPVP